MDLFKLKAYLQQHQRVSLSDLCQQFACEDSLMKQMLKHWQRKGCVAFGWQKSACGSCQICPQAQIAMVEWLEQPT